MTRTESNSRSPASLREESKPPHSVQRTRRPGRKRVVTAARREQNRLAQRAYRERQRARRQSAAPRAEGVREIAPRPSSSPSTAASSLELQSAGHAPVVLVVDSQSPTSSTGDASSRTAIVETRGADPLANAIQTTQDTIWSAILHNARCLGFDLEKLAECNDSYLSPFYKCITPTDNPSDIVASSLDLSIPVHLQPTMAQVLVPHHASLDLIPLPLLRERAIMLSFARPDVYNLWELKLDIYTRRALVCRRSLDNGAETCQPWESKGWLAKPWFMKKWCVTAMG